MLDLQTGDLIAERFRVEALLGEGGIARVYRVRHVRLGSVHAVKILMLARPSLADRLLLEGRIQAQLRHPNLVRVTDVVEHQGNPCLVMEYVDGTHLQALLVTKGPRKLDAALELFTGVLSAVAAAHDQGILHRDLKPANILLERTRNGLVPKVSDFGIAKVAKEGLREGQTKMGVQMGTPGYMAPEQIEDSAAVDHRADVFALGAILYEMLVGERPFQRDTAFHTMQATLAGDFVPLAERVPDCPDHVSRAVAVALSVDMDRRYSDCHGFADALLAHHPDLRARVHRSEPMVLSGGLHRPEPPKKSSGGAQPTLVADAGPSGDGELRDARDLPEPGGVTPAAAETPAMPGRPAAPDGTHGAASVAPGADGDARDLPAPSAGNGSARRSAAGGLAGPGLATGTNEPGPGAAGGIGAGGADRDELPSPVAARLSPAGHDGPTVGGRAGGISIDPGPGTLDLDSEPTRGTSLLGWLGLAAVVALGVGGAWYWTSGGGGGLETEEVGAPDLALGEAVTLDDPAEGAEAPTGEGRPDSKAKAAPGPAAAPTGATTPTRDAAQTQPSPTPTQEPTGAGSADTTDRQPQEGAASRAAAEQPAVEEPVAEQPAVEEPVLEEPAVEEAAVEEAAVEEAAVEEAAVEEPLAEEPAAEEPAVEEPAAEEPAAEDPVADAATDDPTAEDPAADAATDDAAGETHSPPPEAAPVVPKLIGSWAGSAGGNPLTVQILAQDGDRVVARITFTQGANQREFRASGTVVAGSNVIRLTEEGGTGLTFTGKVMGTGMMGTYGRKDRSDTQNWSATLQ